MLDRSSGAVPPGGPASGRGVARSRFPLPVGAVLLALLQVAEGSWLLAALGGVRIAAEAGLPPVLLAYGVPGQYAVIAVAALRFCVALGLLTRVPAAWILAMLITGTGLAATLTGYAIGRPDDIRLLLDVAAAFYLNQPGVRAIFGIGEGRSR